MGILAPWNLPDRVPRQAPKSNIKAVKASLADRRHKDLTAMSALTA
jgi:hypothetical protein